MHPTDQQVIVELGCGSNKRNPAAIGVDLLDLPGVDIVSDGAAYLASLAEASVSEIYSEHFLEHIDDPFGLLRLAARALKPRGTITTIVPHFSNPYFYSDPTHRSFFGLYTMSYWAADHIYSRRVPHYGEPLPLTIETVRLRFKSSPPFYVRHGFKRLMEYVVNSSVWCQEFYEENLSSILPCYEVLVVMRKSQ